MIADRSQRLLFWEASSSIGWKQMYAPTPNDQKEFGESCGRVAEGHWTQRSAVLFEGSGTPQENLQNQLTWAHEGSQRLNHPWKSMHGLHIDILPLRSRCAAWSSYGFSKNWSEDCYTLLDAFGFLSVSRAALSGLSGRGTKISTLI